MTIAVKSWRRPVPSQQWRHRASRFLGYRNLRLRPIRVCTRQWCLHSTDLAMWFCHSAPWCVSHYMGKIIIDLRR